MFKKIKIKEIYIYFKTQNITISLQNIFWGAISFIM